MKILIIFLFFLLAASLSAQEIPADDYLDLSLEELMKIKVTTAGKTEQQISDIPASVVVITRADIEAYGYQSLKEILSNVPGMYKIDNYQNVSFGVRGFFTNVYNRNIIFMIDGVIQQQPYQNWNDLNLMNLQVESIERIEVVRGPAAIIYGNDAFFGAINIITHPKGKSVKSSANTSFGSDNTYRGNIQVNSISDSTSLNLSAGFYHTDGRDIPFDKFLDSVRRWDNTWIKNGTTKDFFNQNSAYFNISIDHRDFYGNISFDQTERNMILAFAPIYDTTKVNRRENIFRGLIGYRKSLNEEFSFELNSSFVSWSTLIKYTKLLINPDIKYGLADFEAHNFNAELITFYKTNDELHITFGANYKIKPFAYVRNDIPAVSLDRNMQILNTPCISYASFLEIKYDLMKNISLIGGLRAERQNLYEYKNIKYVSNKYVDTFYSYNYDKWNLIPRASIVYKYNSNNILKLMYGQAISYPGLTENSYELWFIHPQLTPQKIATTEINILSVFSNELTYSLSIFYNQLNNLINRQIISDTNGNYSSVNNNSGKMETFGFELQFIFKPIQNLMFDASLNYQKTTNKLFDNEAAYSPKILAYFKAIYSIKKDIILAFNSYYAGSMESDWDELKKARISSPSPAYLNLSANLRFNNIFGSDFYFSLHGDNLLNSEIFYPPTAVNSSYLPKGTYDTGIQIFATFGIKF